MSSYDHGDVPIIVKGEGAYIWDAKGRKYLDALAGLFVSQVGHGRTELAEAAAAQAKELAFFPLWSYAHPSAIELAERVANYAPGDLNRVFFTSGGGEAVETAWKLAKNYFKLTGKPMKHKVISRAVAYHGTTQGALSITGLPALKAQFEPLVPSTFRVPNTNFYRAPERFQGGTDQDLEAFGRWAADEIAVAIENEGPDTVAAVFLEPVQNAGGCFPPPPGYFQRVREICDEYDVLLVSDEVICAFGRLGHMFGAERYGYQPDMITCAKGLTSGYSPLGAMIASDRLMEPFLRRPRDVRARLHLRRPPGLDGGGAGEPRHLRARGPQPARAGQPGRVPLDAREAQGPADRRRRPRRRVLLRHRAGEGQGHQGDLQRGRVREAAARLPVQGALRVRPLLPRRRPRRPGHPAVAAADLRPGALRRDGAEAALRARDGLDQVLGAGPGVPCGRMLPVSTVVAPPSSVLLLVGREDFALPSSFAGGTCAATHDCLAVAVRTAADGPTQVTLSPAPGSAGLADLGSFTLESEGLLSLRDVWGREYDAIGVEPGTVQVTVWGNDPREPDQVELQVALSG